MLRQPSGILQADVGLITGKVLGHQQLMESRQVPASQQVQADRKVLPDLFSGRSFFWVLRVHSGLLLFG
jgi:hypothetical protein